MVFPGDCTWPKFAYSRELSAAMASLDDDFAQTDLHIRPSFQELSVVDYYRKIGSKIEELLGCEE